MDTLKHILRETESVMKMMKETLFGHRVLTYSKKDSEKLRNKVKEPWTDKERQDHVDTVEPLMNKRQFVMPGKDPSLDRYLDLDTIVPRDNYRPSPEDEEEETDIDSQFDKLDISNLK